MQRVYGQDARRVAGLSIGCQSVSYISQTRSEILQDLSLPLLLSPPTHTQHKSPMFIRTRDNMSQGILDPACLQPYATAVSSMTVWEMFRRMLPEPPLAGWRVTVLVAPGPLRQKIKQYIVVSTVYPDQGERTS